MKILPLRSLLSALLTFIGVTLAAVGADINDSLTPVAPNLSPGPESADSARMFQGNGITINKPTVLKQDKQILMAAFTEADVAEGGPSNSTRLRVLVNQAKGNAPEKPAKPAEKAADAEPPAKGPSPTDPFSISTDHAVYGKRVSQQIPAITRVGNRFFCIWYGVNVGEPGTSGEGAGCYNTLACSDDGCQTWKEIAYFVPNPAVEKQSVIDPRLACTPESHLLILIPVTAQKGRTRSVWAVQLTNPLTKDGKFTFAEPNFVDFGFVGSVATIGGSLYLTANQNASNVPYPEESGMKLHRIVSYKNDQIQTELVSKLPFAAADGSENTFFETSLAEAGSHQILACFRGKSGQFMTRSKDGGKTWSQPAAFTAYENAKSTKADLGRSPSGNLILAFNNAPAGRYNMALALSKDGGETWPCMVTVDDRKEPVGTSYPNLCFGAKPDGSYDGLIYVAYDHGRGKKAPDFTQEITVAVIAEADLLAGKSDIRRFIVSK